MAFCANCGNELKDTAKFCDSCGMSVGTAKGVVLQPPNPDEKFEFVNLPSRNEGSSKEKHPKHNNSFAGVVYKCPSCGEPLEAFKGRCPACGHELRSSKTVNELSKALDEATESDKRDSLIRTFYIPNTKEDIYEFFILASSNINSGGDEVDAWRAKLDQAYKKAELVFDDKEELERLEELYLDAKLTGAASSTMAKIKQSRLLQSAVALGLGIVLILLAGFFNSLYGSLPAFVGSLCGLLSLISFTAALPLFILGLISDKSKNSNSNS